MGISGMAIRCLAWDTLVDPHLLEELIKTTPELNHAMHGVVSGTVDYKDLLELVDQHV